MLVELVFDVVVEAAAIVLVLVQAIAIEIPKRRVCTVGMVGIHTQGVCCRGNTTSNILSYCTALYCTVCPSG